MQNISCCSELYFFSEFKEFPSGLYHNLLWVNLGIKKIFLLYIYVYISFISLFIFRLYWVLVSAQAFSLVSVSRGYSLPVVRRLLTAAASLVMEHRLWVFGLQSLRRMGPVAAAHRL